MEVNGPFNEYRGDEDEKDYVYAPDNFTNRRFRLFLAVLIAAVVWYGVRGF